MSSDSDWYIEEFCHADLGDERLNSRLLTIVGNMSKQPSSSINVASGSFSEAKSAYRFFANPSITSEALLVPHQEQALRRSSKEDLILAIQDSTTFNFSSHPATTGLGSIGTSHNYNISGLNVHTTIGLSLSGTPLGIINQQMWARSKETKNRATQNIKDKESYKWLSALEETKHFEQEARTQVVTVADRESDIYEFLQTAEEQKASYVIRARFDRKLFGESRAKAPTISSYLDQGPLEPASYDIEVPIGRDITKKRKTRLEVRYKEICLRPPNLRPEATERPLTPLIVTAIIAKEKTPPPGEKPIHWTLLTNIEVNTFEDVQERIRWYSLRWQIEVYHKILKSGLKIEECRLNEGEKLKKYATLCSVVGWKLHELTRLSRVTPEEPCTKLLTESEWKMLYAFIHKSKKLPSTPPSIGQATIWIAQMGGYLNRKRDPPPGVTVIWRGMQRLSDMTITWEILN